MHISEMILTSLAVSQLYCAQHCITDKNMSAQCCAYAYKLTLVFVFLQERGHMHIDEIVQHADKFQVRLLTLHT